MEGFYCHLEPILAAPVGIHACSDLEAGAMAYECSSSSAPLSMAMEQLQGSFPPSLSAEAADCGGGGGDKGRRVVSIERSSASTWLGSAAQEMDGSGSSSRKNKRRSNANVAGVKGKRASRGHGVEEEEATEEEAAGYIHVRARRGQATDSHSVAERLRREKINEKMKMLQSLVPGCDKLAGKALLDEIIGYVHSLQNQVEFLSMKLAFLNPTMLHELGQDMGSVYHPHAPRVLKTAAMPPHEDPVEWMGQATAPASLAAEAQGVVPSAATAGLAQMQLQVQQQEELNSSSSFFQHYD